VKDYLLEIKDLTVRFGGLTAVDNVNIKIEEGKIYGIIGPNGAGKTTIFNMISGAVQPSSGDILFEGKSIVGLKMDKIARLGLSRTFQNIRLFEKISVLDNIIISLQRQPEYNLIQAFLRTKKVRQEDNNAREKAKEYLELVGLSEYANAIAGSLPYGLQRRLEIARALATSPKLLQLDEPAAGMNNEECARLTELIKEIHNKTQTTILLIEHHMDVVVELCSEIYVLNLGKLLCHGSPREIQTNPDVIKVYLGEGRNKNASFRS
jgi:branched-chain amino acid transport system ATP-binding protein